MASQQASGRSEVSNLAAWLEADACLDLETPSEWLEALHVVAVVSSLEEASNSAAAGGRDLVLRQACQAAFHLFPKASQGLQKET